MNKEEIKNYYRSWNARWKTPAARLGMGSPAAQRKSFNVTLDFIEKYITLYGKSIHDAGCGHGALYPIIKERGIASYIGSDLMETTIEEGNRLYPDAPKQVLDILEGDLPKVDITLLMGVMAGWDANDAYRMLERAINASNRAVVFYHWMDTPEGNLNHTEAMLLQGYVDNLLEVYPHHTASMRFTFNGGDRLVLLSKESLQ